MHCFLYCTFTCIVFSIVEDTAIRINKQEKTGTEISSGQICRHRPIFPGRRQPSIVGVNELNYRVRNGNGCTLITKNTYYLFFSEKTFVTITHSLRYVKKKLVTRGRIELPFTA